MMIGAVVFVSSPGPASAYEFTVAASNSGAALTPWVGTLDGRTEVVSVIDQPDGSRVWTRHSETTATPPIPGESWFPRQARGRQAMYQLIQFIVDWLCSSYQPSSPTLIGDLTGYEFDQDVSATNADFGIVVEVRGAFHADLLPALTGEAAVVAELPFPYCLNTYLVTGLVSPDGPGFARVEGEASLPLFDGTTLVLVLAGRYAFDPALALAAPYEFELTGAFAMASEEPQVWSLESSYLERTALVSTPAVDTAPAGGLTAFPNPFRSATVLRFELSRAGSARLDIVDVAGRRVRSLVEGERAAGDHVVAWDGRTEEGLRAPAGVYWGRLEALGGGREEKLIVLD